MSRISVLYRLRAQVVKFGLVGVLNTGISYLIFVGLIYLGVNYLLSSFLSYVIAILNSFYLNKNWTFGDSKKASASIFLKFVAINLFTLSLNLGAMLMLVEYLLLKPLLSQVIATLIVMVVNFVGYRLLFTQNKAEMTL